VRGILGSYRWRRRFYWTLPFVGVAVGVAALVIWLPAGSGIPPTPPPSPLPADAEVEAPVARAAPVTPRIRREVDATLTAFVRAAVTRSDPGAAWELATPALRAGSTRADWRRGDLPVFPFPAVVREATGWYVIESLENDLLIGLVMHARPGTKRGTVAFQVELKRVGEGRRARWLVDSFIPERVYLPTPAARGREVKPLPANFRPEYPSGRLGSGWFLVPGILLSLIVLVPLGVWLVSWRRGVKAERAYRRGLAQSE
jgi:hypothetical protein